MILQPQTIIDQNIFHENFVLKEFPRKLFCNIKKFSTEKFFRKFLVQRCFRGNDFATIKIFDLNIFIENVWSNLFPRKLFCNNKKFSTNKFFMKILVPRCFPGNDFATIKIFDQKIFVKIFGSQVFLGE